MQTTMIVSLAVLSVLAAMTAASPCTDVCNGNCDLAKGACDLVGLLGPLCGTQNGMCKMACGAVCNCVDTCGAKCGGELMECRKDGNPITGITCGLAFTMCSGQCHIQCGASTIAGIVQQMAPPAA